MTATFNCQFKKEGEILYQKTKRKIKIVKRTKRVQLRQLLCMAHYMYLINNK